MEIKDKDLVNLPNMHIYDSKPEEDVWPVDRKDAHWQFTEALALYLKQKKINLKYATMPVLLYNGKQIEMRTRKALADAKFEDTLAYIYEEIKREMTEGKFDTFVLYTANLGCSLGMDMKTFQYGGETTFFFTTYRGACINA